MPPNILWLLCDELRPDGVGCYGNRWAPVHTPNIDAEADRGMRFTQAYVNSTICVSSRVAMVTGRSPFATGAYGNEAWRHWETSHRDQTFPEVLASAGYRTINLGKQHLPGRLEPFELSDETHADQMRLMHATRDVTGEVIRNRPGSVIGAPWSGAEPYPHDALATQAASWLTSQAPVDTPWLLRVSFLQPHTPVVVPEPYASMYLDDDWIGDDAIGPGGPGAFQAALGDLSWPDGMGADAVHQARARYYGLCSWVDAQIGVVLGALAASGQHDDTIVVFCADHGAGLGEGGNWAKHTFAPQVHRTPLIVAGPGIAGGEQRSDLCQLLDLAPTLLGVAGADADHPLDGRDLMSGEPTPDHIVSVIGYGLSGSLAQPLSSHGTWPDGRSWPQRVCVRDGRYRLDRNTRIEGGTISSDHPDADVVLVDSADDPTETINRAHDADHATALDRLKTVIDDSLTDAVTPELGDFYERWPELLEQIMQERLAAFADADD